MLLQATAAMVLANRPIALHASAPIIFHPPTMASLSTLLRQMYPPSPKWSVDKIVDLSGKVFVVTGANTGIGKETCKQLLLKNAKVYLAARSESKAQATIEELEKETGKKAIFHYLDLSDLDAVKISAREFLMYVLAVPMPMYRVETQLTYMVQKGDQVKCIDCKCRSNGSTN